MNYELAKELKDAGFKGMGASGDRGDFVFDGLPYDEPTLSELIDALGDQFWDLRTPRLNGKISSWQAMAYNEIWRKGSTPEEAVARLWLALQGK